MFPTVPAGVTNVFPIDPLGQPICLIFWFLRNLEGINPHHRLLEILGQVGDGRGEVGGSLGLGHNCVPVCRRHCRQVNESIVGVLSSFSEVVGAMVSRQPGG